MRTKTVPPRPGAAALTLTALALASGQAFAVEYWLEAKATDIVLPSPPGSATPTITVPAWGYASCSAAFASCGAATVPGPALEVLAGDSVLTVHLKNSLAKPTSLVVNGLFKTMAPVWDDGSSGNRPTPAARVRSFDAEAQPNGGAQADYTWTGVRPGTYLYQSGTQPQVQVQMGLYGAVTKNALEAGAGVRAQAYPGAANEYDNRALLLYSEVDPALHAAVADGSYGTVTGPTSTFAYEPRYFLINGRPYEYGATPAIVPAGAAGTTLLRFLNAGLTTHVPSIQGRYWAAIAEDGKAYPFKQNLYTALLPAAKTMDVLLTPDIGGAVYPIVDRRLNLSNAGASYGGMLAFLQYGAAGAAVATPGDTNVAPTANPDTYSSIAGVELNIGAASGVLANDVDSDGPQALRAVAASGATSAGGSYVLNANGSFIYTPPAVVVPVDGFSYRATDGKLLSALASVTINLDAPVAPVLTVLDNFDRSAAPTAGLGADWAQAVPTTSSAPNLQLNGTQATAAAVDTGGQAIWIRDTDPGVPDTSVFGARQYAGFSAAVLANSALILKATGGTPVAPANFVRVRIEGAEVVVATQVGGNNTPVYVKQAAFPAGGTGGTLSAVVDAKGLVTVFLDGAFKGGVQLPDVGAWKGPGRAGIQLQTLDAVVDDFSAGTLP